MATIEEVELILSTLMDFKLNIIDLPQVLSDLERSLYGEERLWGMF